MRRLYVQIYLALIGSLILFGVLATVVWLLSPPRAPELDGLGALLEAQLPASDRPLAELEAALKRIGDTVEVDLAVFGADGERLASVGPRLPGPPPGMKASGWIPARGHGPTAALRLSDGRWLVGRYRRPHGRYGLAVVALLALAVAIGAYPVVRRITGRVERLQRRVDQLGAGDLTARVAVEGNDEVASLARSFNRAADRIERLVDAQRSMLASASHELRTPLTRIRMALELLGREARPELHEQMKADIGELDVLIEEILLASQLDATEELERVEDVDLLALLAEESARTGAEVSGRPTHIRGDARLLRRLIRNLLENARRYAGVSQVEVSLEPLGDEGALLRVADRGPGIPESERERIFAPFYRLPGAGESTDGGAGLGLALVRRIARRHRGDVRCYPRDGGGTFFEAELHSA